MIHYSKSDWNRSKFRSDAMILANSENRKLGWISAKACVWKGPLTLRSKFPLATIYPDCQTLFSKALGLQDTTFATVVEDL